ncbi:MAG: sialate O-acetylesterase [Pseudomonadota bacterium]
MDILRIAPLLALWCATACTVPTPDIQDGGKTYHVYFLGGQSNMEGYGSVADLPDDLQEIRHDFPIFMGNMPYDHDRTGGLGLWAPLSPGFGKDFGSNGKRNRLSAYFGPELTFAREMKRLNPDQNIALIKYARSGSSIAVGASHGGNWQPDYRGKNGLNQYDFAIRTIRTAMAREDIDGDGLRDRLIPAGLLWMQGEGDAIAAAPADAYYLNLDHLMHHLRQTFRAPTLPLVIGKITDSNMNEGGTMMPHIERVHAAQVRLVSRDPCAVYLTETEDYAHADDGWHYTSEGYIRLGRAFAKHLNAVPPGCRDAE